VDGAKFYLQKNVAGAVTTISQPAAVLVNGNFYWIQPTIGTFGTSYAATLENDAAGAVGANVATIGAQTIADGFALANKMAIGLVGAGMQFGGNFADVLIVKIPGPPGWTPDTAGGVPSYAVSRQDVKAGSPHFSGFGALSLRHAHTSGNGRWRSNAAVHGAGATLTLSLRQKVVGVATVGARALTGDGSLATAPITGTVDWTAYAASGVVAGANQAIYLNMAGGTGIVYWDNIWYAQQAYDTGNSGDGSEYVATGARAVSFDKLPTPTGFNVDDFAVVTAYRPDHASTVRQLYLWALSDGVANAFAAILGGTNWAYKLRAGIASSATNGAAYAAGDTIVHGFRFRAGVGLTLFWS